MIKTILLLISITFLTTQGWSQKFYTQTGYIRFFSETFIENIEAENNQSTCIVDIETGEVISKVKMKSFIFKKSLMQEHFNENYVESDKYPNAILKAKIKNLSELDFNINKKQIVILEGDLTIHNSTQAVTINGEFEKKDKDLKVQSKFIVKTADYGIKIPKIVRNNIAKEIEVSLIFNLEEFKN